MANIPSSTHRLEVLDGLRGIAMILVFFAHIDTHILAFLPFSTILGVFFINNGGLGVAFLFILSGFLMAYLYPHPTSWTAFVQKRYTRIFPLFLTVSLSFFISQYLSKDLFSQLSTLLSVALAIHFLWIYYLKKLSTYIKQKIFFFFFIFQIIIAMFYLVTSQNSSVLNHNTLPLILKISIAAFVHATLAFPFGNYVTILDPVYWSLIAEILFYILYPIVFTPIINLFSKESRITKLLVLLSLFPLLLGIEKLSEKILSFNIVRFDFFVFFVVGMTLGYLYRNHPTLAAKIFESHKKFWSITSLLIFISIFPLVHLLYDKYFSGPVNLEILGIVFFILLITILMEKTVLAKIFSLRLLSYIGTVSYSIYLTHIFVIDFITHVYGSPHTILQAVSFILLSFLLTTCLASILYFLLEKPYFSHTKTKKIVTYKKSGYEKYAVSILGGVILLYLTMTWIFYTYDIRYTYLHDAITGTTTMYPTMIYTSSASEEKKTLFLIIPFISITSWVCIKKLRSNYFSLLQQ